jgi:hypothetical protein
MVNQLPPEFDVQTLRRSNVATLPRSDALFIRSCPLFEQRVFQKPFEIRRFRTLSKNCRVCVYFLTRFLINNLSLFPLCFTQGGLCEGNSLVPRNGRRFQPSPESQTPAWRERLDPVGKSGNPPIPPFRLR